MRSIAVFTFFATIIVTLSLVNAQSLSEYEFYAFTGASYSDNEDFGFGFNTTADSTCDIQMEIVNTFESSASFQSIANYRSPHTNIFASTIPLTIEDSTCNTWGISGLVSVSENSGGFYETKVTYTQSADSGFVGTLTRMVCETNDIFLNFTIPNSTDDSGNCIWRTKFTTTDVQVANLFELLELQEGGICEDHSNWVVTSGCTQSTAGAAVITYSLWYPFNSSGGTFFYNFSQARTETSSGLPGNQYTVRLVNFDDNTTTVINTQTIGASNDAIFDAFGGSQVVLPDQRMGWFVNFKSDVGAGTFDLDAITVPEVEMSISAYKGDFVCGDFSTCINGSQTRTCVDINGIAPDRIEPRSCFSVPSESFNHGFEDFFERDVWICYQNPFALCIAEFNLTIARFPVGWEASSKLVNSRYLPNYITMTSEKATEGTRSLKMWSIGGFHTTPVDFGTPPPTCFNNSIGHIPDVNFTYNESIFVAQNITFETPNAQIRFDVRRCDREVEQFSNPICGTSCYGDDCNETKGNYIVVLKEIVAGTEIFALWGTATTEWKNRIIDLSTLDTALVTGTNYSLQLFVNPDSSLEMESHCVLFDDVRTTYTETSLPACAGTETCSNLDKFTPIVLSGGACSFEIEYDSPDCARNESERINLENNLNYCVGTTQRIYNNLTEQYDDFTDSDICTNIIEEENRTTDATEKTTGENILSDMFDAVQTKFFWGMVILMLFMLVPMTSLLLISKQAESVLVAPIIGIPVTMGLVVFGFFDFWVALIIGTGEFLLLASMLTKIFVKVGG